MLDDAIVEKARSCDVQAIAERLLVHDGGHKYACPVCPSSDALHVDGPDVAFCYSAQHPTNGQAAALDGIDLVQAAKGMSFVDAVEWLTGHSIDTAPSPSTASQGTSTTDPHDQTPAAPPTTTKLLRRIIANLDLHEPGIRYLSGRGISESLARQAGIVETTHHQWAAYCSRPRNDQLLKSSGLVAGSSDDPSLHPYYDRFLIFPYWSPGCWTFHPEESDKWLESLDSSDLSSVRFRTLSGDEPKMMSLTSDGPAHPDVPYLYGCVDVACTYDWPLFVVEGELDALSIMECEWPAVGAPGATTWSPQWCDRWDELTDVIVVAEGDHGGDIFAKRVQQSAAQRWGSGWTRARMSVFKLDEGEDVNDLRMKQTLTDALEMAFQRFVI